MNFISKKLLIIATLIIFVIFGTIALGFMVTQNNPSQKQSPPNSSSLQQNLTVLNYSPSNTESLSSGIRQSFTISFNTSFSPSLLSVILQDRPIESNQLSIAEVKIQYDVSQNTATIIPQQPLKPDYLYTLSIQYNGNMIFSKQYTTTTPTPTPVTNNNITLAQYLPYKTSTWQLTYSPSRNLYFFNLIPDLNSSVDLNTQFQQAQSDALNFIKSKGVDPSTIVIEWKHS